MWITFLMIKEIRKTSNKPVFIVHFNDFYGKVFLLIYTAFGIGGILMKDKFYDLYVEECAKNEKLEIEVRHLRQYSKSLEMKLDYLEKNMEEKIRKSVETAVAQVSAVYEKEIERLNKKICHLESLLNIDSTNSGLPTSKTPIGKRKKIPNSRTSSGQKIGGQEGHKKHKLEGFEECDVTDFVPHEIDVCPNCGSESIDVNDVIIKDELDFEIIIKKKRHQFFVYTCKVCGETFKTSIPMKLKEENQYGSKVQALSIALVNQGCVSFNRTKEIITGLTEGQINLSEGYISKLQKRMGGQLTEFMKELKKAVIGLPIVHWDDTVIAIATKRACLRYYGDNKIALYTAHERKDKSGLDDDGILSLLGKETVVVHDHNIINYNDEYIFQNAECCVHLMRDLQKVIDNLNHDWALSLIKLLTSANQEKKTGVVNDVYIDYVLVEYNRCVMLGETQNDDAGDIYYVDVERALLKRLKTYRDNYLMWVVNEEVPFSNNESERSLRGSKTKMKVSGQFQNINSAQNYANIKSYLETGKRHGMNSMILIQLALDGNFCTFKEMCSFNDKHKS